MLSAVHLISASVDPSKSIAEINEVIRQTVQSATEANGEARVVFEAGEYVVPHAESIELLPRLIVEGYGATIKKALMPPAPALEPALLAYLNDNFATDATPGSAALQAYVAKHRRPQTTRSAFMGELQCHLLGPKSEKDDACTEPGLPLPPAVRELLEDRSHERWDRVYDWLTTLADWYWSREMGCNRYEGATDSRDLNIRGFTFDGNRRGIEAQGWPYRQYQLQQASMLYLSANEKTALPGRLRVNLLDCTFQEGVSDGLSIGRNVDVTAQRCRGINVFRGGVTLHNSNSSLHLDQYDGVPETDGGLPSTINIEVEAGPGGTTVTMHDVAVDYLEIGRKDRTPVHVQGHRVRVRQGLRSFVHHGKIVFKESQFYGTRAYLGHRSHNVLVPCDTTYFVACEFCLSKAPPCAPPPRAWEDPHTAAWPDPLANAPVASCLHLRFHHLPDKLVLFEDCRFASDAEPLADDGLRAGLYLGAEQVRLNNRIQFDGGEIMGHLDLGIYLSQGGKVRLSGTALDVRRAFYWSSSGGGYLVDVAVENVDLSACGAYGHLMLGSPEPTTPGPIRRDRLVHAAVHLRADQNVISTDTKRWGRTTSRIDFEGSRHVVGSEAPSDAPGFPGDLYEVPATDGQASRRWHCTDALYTGPPPGVAGTWEAAEE